AMIFTAESPKEAKDVNAAEPAAGIASPEVGELPFGPGLALGVVVTWFAWPWLAYHVQFVFFDVYAFGVSVVVLSIGMVAAGLLLPRPEEDPAPPAAVSK